MIEMNARSPGRWSRGDLAFAAGFLAYLAVMVALLVAGLLVYLASSNPDFHSWLHTIGFAAETPIDRLALGIAGASHLPQSLSGIAIDYGFSLFNIALALQLLRLRPRNRTARLLAVGMIGTAAGYSTCRRTASTRRCRRVASKPASTWSSSSAPLWLTSSPC